MLAQIAEQIARVHGVDAHKVGVGGHVQVQLVRLAQVARWTGHHLSQPAGARGGIREVRAGSEGSDQGHRGQTKVGLRREEVIKWSACDSVTR